MATKLSTELDRRKLTASELRTKLMPIPSRQAVHAWIRGEYQPQRRYKKQIAALLEIGVEELFYT